MSEDPMLYSFPDNYCVEHFAHALGTLHIPFSVAPNRQTTDVVVWHHKGYLLDVPFVATSHGGRLVGKYTNNGEPLQPISDIEYLIDTEGVLWRGPNKSDDTMHWAHFDGYMTVTPFNPIWTLSRSARPEKCIKVSYQTACDFALLQWQKQPNSVL